MDTAIARDRAAPGVPAIVALSSIALGSVAPAARGNELFGRTTTLVPTSTRLNRSLTSSLVSRMQPEETNFPIVEGSLVPWMRYSLEPRYIARAPSGLPG